MIEVDGRSTGAPLEACGEVTDIVPNHLPFNASDNEDIPYSLDLYNFEYTNGTYIPGYYYYCKYYYSESIKRTMIMLRIYDF